MSDNRYDDSNGNHYDGAALLSVPGDAAGSAQAAYFPTVAKLLGEAIPALSFPVGSNPVPVFDEAGGGNFNLNTSFTGDSGYEVGWPASRGTDKGWRHADYIDVSYTFVFPLFDKIIAKGGLK